MRITDYDIGLRNYFDNVFYSADGEGGSSRGEEDRIDTSLFVKAVWHNLLLLYN